MTEKLSFDVIKEPLDKVVEAVANKIQRESNDAFESIPSARPFFLVTIKSAQNTYKTIRYICADKPEDPIRKLEYALACPALSRTILDSLFTIVFVLEDLPNRLNWYHKAGWREMMEKLKRYKDQYGTQPEWKEWFDIYEKHIKTVEQEWNLSEEEIQTNKKQIRYWPNPGKMIRWGISQGNEPPASRHYLSYMNDWFYRDLSAEAHLSYPGLLTKGFLVDLPGVEEEWIREKLVKMKSDQVFIALTLLLALVSEMEVYFKFQLTERIQYLWTILNSFCLATKEVYEFRYEQLLKG